MFAIFLLFVSIKMCMFSFPDFSYYNFYLYTKSKFSKMFYIDKKQKKTIVFTYGLKKIPDTESSLEQ